MKRVAVIGGGLAGTSAALSLAENGISVVLFEQRSLLGGRAYSPKRPNSPAFDNGQHITLGCYEALKRFLEKIQSSDCVSFQKNLAFRFLEIDQKPTWFRAARLPAPLHLAVAILRARMASGRDLFALWKFQSQILNSHTIESEWTVSQWVEKLQLPQKLKQRLIYPMTIGALNTHPKEASAKLLANVFKRAFFGRNQDSSLGLFAKPLSEVFDVPAKKKLHSLGVELNLNQMVTKICPVPKSQIYSIQAGEQTYKVEAIVSAVPYRRMENIFDESLLSRISKPDFEPSAIISAYIELSQGLVVGPDCLIGTDTEWVFDLKHVSPQGNFIAATKSAANEWMDLSIAAIEEKIRGDLTKVYNISNDLIKKIWVIKEKNATIKHTPAAENMRPSCQTPFKNIFLAGDWTDTQLPCTLEGAVISGEIAAGLCRAWMVKDRSEV